MLKKRAILLLLLFPVVTFGQLDPDNWKRPFRNKVLIRTHLLPYTFFNTSGVSGMIGVEYRFGAFHSVGFDGGYHYSETKTHVPDVSGENLFPSKIKGKQFSLHLDYRFHFPSIYRDYAFFRPYLGLSAQLKTKRGAYNVGESLETDTLNYTGLSDTDVQRLGFRLGIVFSDYFSEWYSIDFSVGPTYGRYFESTDEMAEAYHLVSHRIENRFGLMARLSFNVLLNPGSGQKQE